MTTDSSAPIAGWPRVTILSARQGWHTDELSRALRERGATANVVPYETLVARFGRSTPSASGRPLGLEADAVLARIIPSGSLEQIIYRVDALHWLEDSGVHVMNSPRTIERTVDKFYTSALLEQAGLATPETVVCERSEDAMAAFREMGDVIVKPLFGSMGLGMVRVSDEEIAWRVFRALDAVRGVYYLQRTIDHRGRDVRVFVDRPARARRDRAIRIDRRGRTAVAHECVARRPCPSSGPCPARMGGGSSSGGRGGRRRLCGRRPAARCRRHAVRARSERDPGVAGASISDRD